MLTWFCLLLLLLLLLLTTNTNHLIEKQTNHDAEKTNNLIETHDFYVVWQCSYVHGEMGVISLSSRIELQFSLPHAHLFTNKFPQP